MIEEDRWITTLKALADRSRLRIVQTLLEQPLTVNDLSDRLAISQYNVSKHLRILREAGIVEAAKLANRREYSIPAHHLGDQRVRGVLELGLLQFRFAELPAQASSEREPAQERAAA